MILEIVSIPTSRKHNPRSESNHLSSSDAPASMEKVVADHDTLDLHLGRGVRLQRIYWRHLKDHPAVQREHHSCDAGGESLRSWFCCRSAALGPPERNLRPANHVRHNLWGPYSLQRWMCWGSEHGNFDRASFFRRHDWILATHRRSNSGTACLYQLTKPNRMLGESLRISSTPSNVALRAHSSLPPLSSGR